MVVVESLGKLIKYCEENDFKGYDPYDTLNTWFPFIKFGNLVSAIAIQIQKRNPINIRPILGISKGYNPKGMGLFLSAYSKLYNVTKNPNYLETARWLFDWLNSNYTKGYSGKCWGYNFHWATPNDFLTAFTPSVVVTSFIVDGVWEYYNITRDIRAKELILSASEYIKNDIPITQLSEGISFAYTHLSKGCCYNASLLAAEVLAKADTINGSLENQGLINRAIDFVLSKQKPEGEWWYSYNPETGTERKQIDFHQGFVIVSLSNLNSLIKKPREVVDASISRGLEYYKKNQFLESGQSLWRIPKKWPIDIHNQSQGIITFSKLKKYNPNYNQFARQITGWTIENMQSPQGFFYYRKNKVITNKIPYIRWSQAWMMLALTELLQEKENGIF